MLIREKSKMGIRGTAKKDKHNIRFLILMLFKRKKKKKKEKHNNTFAFISLFYLSRHFQLKKDGSTQLE